MIDEKINDIDEAFDEDEGVESDRISIFQWIFMFALLGAVIYFSPMLLKLLPK